MTEDWWHSAHTDPQRLTRQAPSERQSGHPAYMAIRNLLTEQIHTGRLAPGARLPSERDLAGDHGVARMTARKALGLLEAEGLIHSAGRRGYFVSPPRVRYDPVSPVNLMKQLRLQGLRVENIHLGRQFLDASGWFARQFGVPDGTPLVLDRNVVRIEGRYVIYEEDCLLSEAVPGYAGQPYISPMWQNLQQNFGVWPRRSDLQMRVSSLGAEVARYLRVTGDTSCLTLSQAHEFAGRTIAVTRTVWLADAVDIVIGPVQEAEGGEGTGPSTAPRPPEP